MIDFHQGRQLTLSLMQELGTVLKELSEKSMEYNGAGDSPLQ